MAKMKFVFAVEIELDTEKVTKKFLKEAGVSLTRRSLISYLWVEHKFHPGMGVRTITLLPSQKNLSRSKKNSVWQVQRFVK